MSALSLGVDLGGTKIEAVVVELAPFREIARRRVATERDEGYDAIVQRTAAIARDVARDAGVDLAKLALGVGMPGGVTRTSGLVKNSNTVCLNGRPFREDLARALGRVVDVRAARSREGRAPVDVTRRVVFDNDANCFALAEAELGAAREHRDGVVFGVILGTGVGGGIVLRGAAWDGAQGIAGEWGHHAVWAGSDSARPCYCGRRGCMEQYASGPAVEGDYAARSGTRRPLAEIAARVGDDAHAAAAIDGLVDAFGRGLANVIDIVDPSVVVLGGGVSNLDVLYTEGIDRVRRYVFNDELVTPIVRHALGDSAGVLGAALRAR